MYYHSHAPLLQYMRTVNTWIIIKSRSNDWLFKAIPSIENMIWQVSYEVGLSHLLPPHKETAASPPSWARAPQLPSASSQPLTSEGKQDALPVSLPKYRRYSSCFSSICLLLLLLSLYIAVLSCCVHVSPGSPCSQRSEKENNKTIGYVCLPLRDKLFEVFSYCLCKLRKNWILETLF